MNESWTISELHRGCQLSHKPVLLQSLPLEKFMRVVSDIMQPRARSSCPFCPRICPWKAPKEALVAVGKTKGLELALNPTTNIATEPVTFGGQVRKTGGL